VKVTLVIALPRNKLWAYPWMIAVLVALIAYQVFLIVLSPTWGWIAPTAFDVLIVVLTWRDLVTDRLVIAPSRFGYLGRRCRSRAPRQIRPTRSSLCLTDSRRPTHLRVEERHEATAESAVKLLGQTERVRAELAAFLATPDRLAVGGRAFGLVRPAALGRASSIGSAGTPPQHVKNWCVDLYLFEQGARNHGARSPSYGCPTALDGRGETRRNPSDVDIPEIGDEVAAARALRRLADRLLGVASDDIEAVEAHEVHPHP